MQFICEDLNQNFTTSLPLEALLEENVILAFKYGDEDLSIPHGGPVRLIVPGKYFYKSAKWVRKIRFIEKDELGYWERMGYSNEANLPFD